MRIGSFSPFFSLIFLKEPQKNFGHVNFIGQINGRFEEESRSLIEKMLNNPYYDNMSHFLINEWNSHLSTL